jgi:hypothetical protein
MEYWVKNSYLSAICILFEIPGRWIFVPMKLLHTSLRPLLALITSVACLQAQVITDSFLTGGSNYSTGNITGQNPTVTGFTGAWGAGSVTTASVNATGLTYSNASGAVATEGGSVFIGTAGQNAGRVFRELSSPINVNSDSVVYMSVLMQNSLTNNTTQYRAFELSTLSGPDTTRTLQLGLSSADFGTVNYGFRLNNNSTFSGDLGFSNTATNFFVIKLSLSSTAGNDSITIWGNPSDLSDESLSGSGAGFSGITLNNNIETVRFSGFGPGSTFFDEVRIGSSWQEVTTVPEPSTWALLGVAGLAVLAFARRRGSKSEGLN